MCLPLLYFYTVICTPKYKIIAVVMTVQGCKNLFPCVFNSWLSDAFISYLKWNLWIVFLTDS